MPKSALEAAFDKMRETRDWEWVLKPFLQTRFHVAGAEFPLYDKPVFYARASAPGARPTLTASEFKSRIDGNPGVVPMDRTGLELVTEMDRNQELMILYESGGELLGKEQLDYFRQALKLDPRLKRG